MMSSLNVPQFLLQRTFFSQLSYPIYGVMVLKGNSIYYLITYFIEITLNLHV